MKTVSGSHLLERSQGLHGEVTLERSHWRGHRGSMERSHWRGHRGSMERSHWRGHRGSMFLYVMNEDEAFPHREDASHREWCSGTEASDTIYRPEPD